MTQYNFRVCGGVALGEFLSFAICKLTFNDHNRNGQFHTGTRVNYLSEQNVICG